MTGDQPAVPEPAELAPNDQVRLVTHDDLERSRLTTFFRLFLALPHLFVLAIWSGFAGLIAVFNWFAILITRKPVKELHDLQVMYLRYFTHVDAYLNLAANPFPSFGAGRPYPIDLEAPAAGEQDRVKTGFRLILAIPAILLGGSFGAAGVQAGGGSARVSFGVIAAAGFLGWFAVLALKRMPRGLRDLLSYGLAYSAQVGAYLLLVTERYPNSDPLAVEYPPGAPDHPVKFRNGDDLHRSRLTVFFRLLLALPHLVWLTGWSILVLFTAVANWFFTLFAGRPAGPLHRFMSAFVRYSAHVTAFLNILANPFPGFVGRPGSYPVDVELPPPERQNRWKTGFRLILAFPVMILSGALSNTLGIVSVFCWFTGLFLGRVPTGLRNLGVFALRYQTQLSAYLFLLTDAYPYSGPSLELEPRPEALAPEPA